MRIDKAPISEETKNKIIKMLNEASAEDKATAIAEAMELIAEEINRETVNRVVEEARRAEQDAEYKKSLGMFPLSENEKKFFERLKMGAKQSLTADQIDIIPRETIDKTFHEHVFNVGKSCQLCGKYIVKSLGGKKK